MIFTITKTNNEVIVLEQSDIKEIFFEVKKGRGTVYFKDNIDTAVKKLTKDFEDGAAFNKSLMADSVS